MAFAFLDSGFLIALALPRDQNHSAARAHWSAFLAAPYPLVTTSFVFDEVTTFLNGRYEHAAAIEIGTTLLTSRWIELVHVNPRLFDAAWRLFREHADKRWSFTDCASFALMRERGLTKAFAFDRHFAQAGFTIEPEE